MCCYLCCCCVFLFVYVIYFFFFFSSRRRHTRWNCDWSSDVCSSDLGPATSVPTAPCQLRPAVMRWRKPTSSPTVVVSCRRQACAAYTSAASISDAQRGTIHDVPSASP